MPRKHWTDEYDAVLRREWAAGLSASQIVTKLFELFHVVITRNAVIGRVNRLGLRRCTVAERELKKRVTPANVRKIAKPKPSKPLPNSTPDMQPAPRPHAPDADIAFGKPPVSILGLTSETCRWPVGDPREPDFVYCGAKPKHGCIYCVRHDALVAPRKMNEAA